MFSKLNKNYYISLESDDWVTPEETLLDSGSQYSDIEKPILGSIFRFFLISFCVLAAVLIVFLFKTAVVEHGVLARLALQNKSTNFPLAPSRGMIVDKSGLPLIRNIPVFNLLAVTRELKENPDSIDTNTGIIGDIIGQEKDSFRQLILEEMKSNSAFYAHLNLTKDQAVAIKYLEPKGFYIVPDTRRDYIDGRKISQLIGYTGKISEEDLRNDEYYSSTDIIGRLGVEGQYEKFLRGKHGSMIFSKEQGEYITKEPQPGSVLVLNMDHDLQIKLYDEIFAVLRDTGLSGAVGIIQDPQTGAIRALVSFPDFDNNVFTGGLSENEYKRLFESRARPLFNRVVSGLYNPGSTIKPFIGMTGLQEKIISSGDTIKDCVSLTVPNPFDREQPYIFRNWRTEYGQFDLKKAIANSCNIYFFTIGGGQGSIKGLGAEKIAKYLKDGFADSMLGIDLPGEKNGFVPTPDWKLREKGESWYLGDTYNMSIGQGDLLITPLWLNSYISAIANGGSIYKPNVAQKIIGENDEVIENFTPEIVGSLPFSNDIVIEMKEAMRETVISGTAQILNQLPVKSGAKTGTAEVIKGKTTNSIFTVFVPYDNPEIAMTILIEGATTQQGLAIRAAFNTLKWYFSK